MNIELEPSSERFDPNDDRWLAQEAQLVADLRREVGEASRRGESRPGPKGLELGPIIVSLGTAGAFTAVAQVLQAFLSRDRGRAVGPDIDRTVLDEALATLERAGERPE